MMLLCYTLFDYDDIILEPQRTMYGESVLNRQCLGLSMHQHMLDFAFTGVLIPFSFSIWWMSADEFFLSFEL